MGIVVSNTQEEIFGVMTQEVTVTHFRSRIAAGDAQPVVVQLAAPLVVPAGRRLRLPAGNFKPKYNSGGFPDEHTDALVKSYWENTNFDLDAMTSAIAAVADPGYAQQQNSDWSFMTEADD